MILVGKQGGRCGDSPALILEGIEDGGLVVARHCGSKSEVSRHQPRPFGQLLGVLGNQLAQDRFGGPKFGINLALGVGLDHASDRHQAHDLHDQQQGQKDQSKDDKGEGKPGNNSSEGQQPPKDSKSQGKQDEQQKQQKPSYEDPSVSRKRQGFKSEKLSQEDSERVMAELSSREKELQARLKKQRGARASSNGKDW